MKEITYRIIWDILFHLLVLLDSIKRGWQSFVKWLRIPTGSY